MTRRAGIYDTIEGRLKAAQFSDGDEAFRVRDTERERKEAIQAREHDDVEFGRQKLLFDEQQETLIER